MAMVADSGVLTLKVLRKWQMAPLGTASLSCSEVQIHLASCPQIRPAASATSAAASSQVLRNDDQMEQPSLVARIHADIATSPGSKTRTRMAEIRARAAPA